MAGVIIGQYYGFDKEERFDPQGAKLCFEEIFLEATSEFTFPIVKSFEFGHRCPSTFLPIGGTVAMEATSGEIRVTQPPLQH